MLTSITLQNFKSFGEEQTIPLRPITVLVGPNNSGKSNLVSLGRFVRNVATSGVSTAVSLEGGWDYLLHRPFSEEATSRIAWSTTSGSYSGSVQRKAGGASVSESLLDAAGVEAFRESAPNPGWISLSDVNHAIGQPFYFLDPASREYRADHAVLQEIFEPLTRSTEIKLTLPALLQDAAVIPNPKLGRDGSGMPTVLALWRGSDPERSDLLEDFVRRCLPEIRHVLVKPSPSKGHQRLWIQQTDGEMFDAEHVSDGVLYFIALAMHAIEAEPGSVLFIEEPEQSVHPRRLGMIVELFREIVAQRKCQIIVVTHAPALLDEFRDEPEAIVLFRRGEKGTRVKQLTELPRLIDALRDAEPGEMLANGFFDAPF